MAICAKAGTLSHMTRKCEVCENFRPDTEPDPRQKVVEVNFGSRIVLLCTGHARIAQNSGIMSFDQLRAFYGKGRRSFVPRRGTGSEPNGLDRHGAGGRRSTDVRR